MLGVTSTSSFRSNYCFLRRELGTRAQHCTICTRLTLICRHKLYLRQKVGDSWVSERGIETLYLRRKHGVRLAEPDHILTRSSATAGRATFEPNTTPSAVVASTWICHACHKMAIAEPRTFELTLGALFPCVKASADRSVPKTSVSAN